MIQGHSGCQITIADSQVIKKAVDYPIDRLLKQAYKQQWFYYNIDHDDIVIPKVNSITINSVRMEFIQHIDMITFLVKASYEEVKRFTAILIQFLQEIITRCTDQQVITNVIKEKYESVKPHNRLDAIFYDLPDQITLPVGVCHGDLTFSNMLYHNGKIVIIDFLDSFIETPLIDISKIWQDTKHGWTTFYNNISVNAVRIWAVFDYINREIEKNFGHYEWFQYCKVFELLSLMRILPYSKDEQTTNFILEKLECVL